MRKLLSRRKQALNNLKRAVRESRKIARQINRKLDSLAQWNRVKAVAQQELIKIMGLK